MTAPFPIGKSTEKALALRAVPHMKKRLPSGPFHICRAAQQGSRSAAPLGRVDACIDVPDESWGDVGLLGVNFPICHCRAHALDGRRRDMRRVQRPLYACWLGGDDFARAVSCLALGRWLAEDFDQLGEIAFGAEGVLDCFELCLVANRNCCSGRSNARPVSRTGAFLPRKSDRAVKSHSSFHGVRMAVGDRRDRRFLVIQTGSSYCARRRP